MAEIDNLVINVEVKGDTNKLNTLANNVEGVGKKSQKATNKVKSFGTSIKNMLKSAAFIQTMRYLGDAINKSMEYTESLNLFTVAMGDYADEAKKYAETVSEAMGIDPAEWLKAQGTFNILATGFGVAADKAAIMSKNLTQLGYDLSSFYNINVNDAMLRLQSGMAGELEPLRRLGYDLSVARLQQEAYALGINKSITAMNQAEKSMLRYHAIMSQVTEVQGDMARTLESPANQTRILKAQVTQLTRSIGNILIPVINKLLPYLIAMAQVAREAAESIALFFGYSLPEIDYSSASDSVGNIATDLDDANDSAKELKRTLMGFDEINKLNGATNDSGADAGGGVGFDMELLEYDFLGDALAKDLDDVKQKLENILPIVGAISAGLATWKLSGFLQSIGLASGRLEALRLAASIGITVAGIAIEWKGIISAFKKGLKASNFGEIAAGAILTVIGSALAGQMIPFVGAQLGAAVGAIVAGIPMFVIGVYDAVVNGLNALNAILIPTGSTIVGAGVGAIIGSLGGPIGAAGGALIGLVIGALTDIGILIYEKWDEIKEFFEPAISWFDEKVCSPISEAWSRTWTSITEWASAAKEVVKQNWSIFSSWFDKQVWQPVCKGASDAWGDIKETFEPITTFFGDLWTTIKTSFSTLAVEVGNAFGDLFKEAINVVLGTVQDVLNLPITAINGLIHLVRKVPGLGDLKTIPELILPRLAEGGQVDAGQLFIAREAGPELVGAIGRKTTVANNQQIVDGIYKGVYQAMRDAGTGNGGGQTIVVMLPNGDVLGETFVNWHNGVVKQTGNTPLLV